MSIIRTDKEVALNDLLVASRETVDHYRDAAEFLEDVKITSILREIADQREPFVARLTHAVRALGDLPSMPDPDKETGAMLLHHAGAFLSDDYATEVLQQRIEAEQHLAELIEAGRAVGLEEECETLLDEISEHVARTNNQLQQLLKQTGN